MCIPPVSFPPVHLHEQRVLAVPGLDFTAVNFVSAGGGNFLPIKFNRCHVAVLPY